MPNLTYPGVYVEELASGVRTITGVSKSTTAFVGRALQGVLDEPATLHSFADFEREFGGLWAKSHLGFSVRDFFTQGGSTAIVVRVAQSPRTAEFVFGNTADAAADVVTYIRLQAASPGGWANRLAVRVSQEGYDATSNLYDVFVYWLAAAAGASPANGENQTSGTGLEQLEVLRRVSTDPAAPNRLDRALQKSSRYLRAVFPADAAVAKFGPSKNVWRSLGTDGENITSTEVKGTQADKTGLWALEKADVVNLVVIPPFLEGGADDGTEITGRVGDATVPVSVLTEALEVAKPKRAMVLMDGDWDTTTKARTGAAGVVDANSAVFFPRITQENPLLKVVEPFAPAGAVAGVIARIDTADTGVSRASAGLDAGFGPGVGLDVGLTDPEIGDLNQLGINCLRNAPAAGPVVWGARTRRGADTLADEWKYLPVRRTALYIELSVSRAIQWAVFAPNDEGLWAQLRLNVGSFMDDLFRKRWFQGASARDAYFVRCDSSTTTQQDIDLGIVNLLVGFAPLKPAEFVVLRLQQIAGANL